MVIPVLLDCDPGHDDAMAILLAAASPAIDLLGITTVAGNQTLPKTTLNARRVCTAAGITSVPIAAGRAQPLHGRLRAAAGIHGETGPNARVAVGLDTGGFWDLVVAAVAALG
jgi:purine nucleosidase/pyrimidine-specific ribonucleoside hydrolase